MENGYLEDLYQTALKAWIEFFERDEDYREDVREIFGQTVYAIKDLYILRGGNERIKDINGFIGSIEKYKELISDAKRMKERIDERGKSNETHYTSQL